MFQRVLLETIERHKTAQNGTCADVYPAQHGTTPLRGVPVCTLGTTTEEMKNETTEIK